MYAMICFIAPSVSLTSTIWGIFEQNFFGESFLDHLPWPPTCIILASGLSGLFVQFAANYLNLPPPIHLNSRRLIFGGI